MLSITVVNKFFIVLTNYYVNIMFVFLDGLICILVHKHKKISLIYQILVKPHLNTQVIIIILKFQVTPHT